jgi:hypothetical protein
MVSSSSASRWRVAQVVAGGLVKGGPYHVGFGACVHGVVFSATGDGWVETGCTCRPHSLALSCSHHQRPARKSSPTADGAGAGCAADAGEELVVQGVVGKLVLGDEVPHIAPGPFDDRADLHPFRLLDDGGHIGPGLGLFAAQTRDPAVLAGQCPRQRFHLPDVAALLAQVGAAVHGVFTLIAHEADNAFGAGPEHLDTGAIALFDLADQGQGFGMQLARVQHKRAAVDAGQVDQMGDHHVFGAQTGGLDQFRVQGSLFTQEGQAPRRPCARGPARAGCRGRWRSWFSGPRSGNGARAAQHRPGRTPDSGPAALPVLDRLVGAQHRLGEAAALHLLQLVDQHIAGGPDLAIEAQPAPEQEGLAEGTAVGKTREVQFDHADTLQAAVRGSASLARRMRSCSASGGMKRSARRICSVRDVGSWCLGCPFRRRPPTGCPVRCGCAPPGWPS